MTVNQREYLDNARTAYKAKDYPEALIKYEYFFDHALDDDPASLYGVRLSYCLNEWAMLGEKYPPAKDRLEQKRDEALSLLFETKEPERFHDFLNICRYLKCPDLPVEEFLKIHNKDKSLSAKIVRFIWDTLVDKKLWEVCAEYLENPKSKYDEFLFKFDHAMKSSKANPEWGGERFEDQVKGWFIRDVSNLLLVLKNSLKNEELEYIQGISGQEMEHRGYTELQTAIDEAVGHP